ncbi:MAG: ATP-binding cassette domain-containing protein [Siphonobacter sp.]
MELAHHRLQADSITIQYGTNSVISGGFLQAETGQITGLLGRNGNGKSSLLKAIFGIIKAKYKTIKVDGEWISDLQSRSGMAAYLPQNNFVPQSFKIKMIFELYGTDFSLLIKQFPELEKVYNQEIGSLSGGERRLVETLLVLCRPVKFVFLDEPFSHLSPITVERLREIIQQEKQYKGIVLTDHLYRHITSLSDNLYLLAHQRTFLIKERDDLIRWGYLGE